MTILDTDHVSALLRGGTRSAKLEKRLAHETNAVALSIITVEEVCKGYLAQINRTKAIPKQVVVYESYHKAIRFFHAWRVLDFNAASAGKFEDLRRQGIRKVGTMDLKIAAIALTNDATVATANLRDFEQVPGLKCENWLD